MRICTIVAVAGALAAACLADLTVAEAQARQYAKYSRVRAIERPPGYSRGGPMYTACDRINRDRMLVGTCR
jgi:hypothetical protein